MKYAFALLLMTLAIAVGARGGTTYPNLLPNGGMEKIAGDLPVGWQPFNIGAPAQFSVDASEHHGGSHSIRISASDTVRSYLVSDYLPVGVGESFAVSAWIKCKDVPAKRGHAILIVDFANSKDEMIKEKIENCGSPNLQVATWQLLQKKITVPEPTMKMRVRLGFSYCSGTTWWDDVSIIPTDALAMQLEIDPQHFVPGVIRVNILNRAGSKGNVRVAVALRRPSKTNPEDAEQGKPLIAQQVPVALTGEAVQHLDIDASLPVEAHGKLELKLVAMLLPAQGAAPIFSRVVDMNVPPAVTLKPLVPTHWAVEDGPARIEGQMDVALSEAQWRESDLTLQLVDTNKNVRAQQKSTGPLVDGSVRFTLVAPELPIGEYRVVATVHPSSGKTIESEQPWSVIPRREAKTIINSGGYPEINGKDVYPLGVFNGRAKQEGEAGFTVTHAYNAIRITPDGYNDDQNCKDFLDRTQKAGMHACCMVPLQWAFAGKWDDFRRRIRMFRNHPALLCWDEEEGVARGDMTLDGLRKAAEIVHQEDPNHPLMIGDSKDVIIHIKDRAQLLPTDIMDMGMWWWYPFPMQRQNGDALNGEQDARSDELNPPAFLVGTQTTKPIWTSLQAYKKNDSSRFPTPQEYRAQAYLGVISGAEGLMWYGGYIGGGIYRDPAGGHLNALEEVVKQLRELSPVIMSPSVDAPAFSPKNAPISVLLKHGPDGLVLLAVNRRDVPVDITFDLAKLPTQRIAVLYENRTIFPRTGKLADHFDSLGVHVYQFSGKR